MKDLSRSQTVTYVVNLVLYRNWCHIASLLLVTSTTTASCTGSDLLLQINSGYSDDLEWPEDVLPTANLSKFDYVYNCAAVDKMSTDSASRGRSMVAELLALKLRAS